MAWWLLAAAILFEVFGTTCMKYSEGFTKPLPSFGLFLSYAIAFTCLTFALKKIELSTAYAIWSGVGTALTALIGFWIFRELITPGKIVWIAVIIVGVVGLKLQS